MRVTMQHVADAAGVHSTTVSLALRHHPSIPVATRKRILQLADELGYRPNPLVSTLMSQLRGSRRRSSKWQETIAFINNHPLPQSFTVHAALREMFEGVQQRTHQLGFDLQVFDLQASKESGMHLRKVLISRGIRTLIIGATYKETTLPIDLDGFAAVSLGSSLNNPILERIGSDHYQCLRLAFSNCLRLGYQRIGLVLSQEVSIRLEDRWLSAFIQQQQQRLPARCRIPPLLDTSEESLQKWLGQKRPDVIISNLSDRWRSMQKRCHGLPIGNLTRLAGDDDCAGIDQNMFKIGQISVERVVSRLHHNDFDALDQMQSTLLNGTWKDGPSLPDRLA